jgi:UDPglucose--hexose-1-phosphate uridylyltransferase
MINLLNSLLTYGLEKKLITDLEKAKLNLVNLFAIADFDYSTKHIDIFKTLSDLLDDAFDKKLFSPNTAMERDAFEALIFDQIMPTPNETKEMFKSLFKNSKDQAIQYLYNISMDVNYIKTQRIKQNINWLYPSSFGNLQMTINLSKPEKDPKDIAKALDNKTTLNANEPKCVLCKENEHRYQNARMNLRIVPMKLHHEKWHFQYSPYAYFNEHAIILSDEHRAMKISSKTFEYLLDFVDLVPNYFIGSNADLPIVGGSILNHDHFQAGRHHFPIEDAKIIKTYNHLEELVIEHLHWPLSTIRLKSSNRNKLSKIANHILESWKIYHDSSLDIIAYTDKPHQTITPILRKENDVYIFDLILRNNRTTKTYPDGIFHPHQDVQHIKKENIGLIEAAGLAILPGRLKQELIYALDYIKNQNFHPDIKKHLVWLDELILANKVQSMDDLYLEVGKKFEQVLTHSGVFKLNEKGIEAMNLFIESFIYSFK